MPGFPALPPDEGARRWESIITKFVYQMLVQNDVTVDAVARTISLGDLVLDLTFKRDLMQHTEPYFPLTPSSSSSSEESDTAE